MIRDGFIKTNSRVLDVGCGLGRLARPIVDYLERGEYDGIDIVRSSIDWCTENYSPYPNFRFHHADIYSTYYNPQSKTAARDYTFPFSNRRFDFQWSTSLFTHMLPSEIDRYLSEIGRTLKKGGRCWNTFLLLDKEASELQQISDPKRMHLKVRRSGYRLLDAQVPEKLIAIDQAIVEELYRKNGLQIIDIRYGRWSGRKGNIRYGFQDCVIALKP
jgi:SAM-dependent methyltransferase